MIHTHPAAEGDHTAVSPWREAAVGVLFLLLGVVMLVLARSIELPDRALAISPRVWPEALGIGITGLSALQIVTSFINTPKTDHVEPATRGGVLRVGGFVLATLAFGVLWYYIHFLVSGMVFVAALTWMAGGRGTKDLVLFPAGITVVLYALFAILLRVPV